MAVCVRARVRAFVYLFYLLVASFRQLCLLAVRTRFCLCVVIHFHFFISVHR